MEENKTHIQNVLPSNTAVSPVNDNEHIYASFVLFQKFMDSFMQVSQRKTNQPQQPQHMAHNSSSKVDKDQNGNNVNNKQINVIKDDDRPIRHSSINFVELVERNLKELGEGDSNNNNNNNASGSKRKWRCNSSENINTHCANNDDHHHSRVHSSSNNNSKSVVQLQYRNSNSNNVLLQHKSSSLTSCSITNNISNKSLSIYTDEDSNDIIYNYSSGDGESTPNNISLTNHHNPPSHKLNTEHSFRKEYSAFQRERELFCKEKALFMQSVESLKRRMSEEKKAFETYRQSELQHITHLKQTMRAQIQSLQKEYALKEQNYQNIIQCLQHEIDILTNSTNESISSAQTNVLNTSSFTSFNSNHKSKSTSMPKSSRVSSVTDYSSMFDVGAASQQHVIGHSNKVVSRDVLGCGKTVIEYDNQTRKTVYPSGDVEVALKDGVRITYYVNNDIKQIYPNGKVVYYYAKNKITQTFLPEDKPCVYKYRNGVVEKTKRKKNDKVVGTGMMRNTKCN